MQSCLYEGQVRHRRFSPRPHDFRYRVFYTYLDLDELDKLFAKRWLWSAGSPSLAWLKRSDYLGDVSVPLKKAVIDKVHEATGKRPLGPVRMLTHLRYFGFVFNPVTFYYCFDKEGTEVETIVAEITNTPWGERFSYVLPASDGVSTSARLKFEMEKNFHVSPFMPMDINYKWYFSVPGEALNIHMVNFSKELKLFDATLTLERRSFSAMNCASVLIRYPLLTIKVITGIYWQAFRLFIKRIPFHTHPKISPDKHRGGAKTAKTS